MNNNRIKELIVEDEISCLSPGAWIEERTGNKLKLEHWVEQIACSDKPLDVAFISSCAMNIGTMMMKEKSNINDKAMELGGLRATEAKRIDRIITSGQRVKAFYQKRQNI